MTATIDRALESLEVLRECLIDEALEETIDQRLTQRGKACKEAQLTLEVLTVKLHALRVTRRSLDTRQLPLQGCEVCE